ncbi:MAG TPA: DUF1361 domain-containing protein [Bacteroidales bacterium]|nr:DUF1361 domain-containing protein [Bacteroidales bacterium]
MIRELKESNRYKETIFLGALSILCFSLSIFRLLYSDTRLFLFLNWNLFLAFLPWLFTSLILVYPRFQNVKLNFILVILWLLFFPNAPYILTDLFHLRLNSTMPIWFDLVLILSFAWTGLMFGFMSLWDIENLLSKKINKKLIPFISLSLLFLGSFGIYIGRYLRWNSWDVIRQPYSLAYDIGDRIINPFHHRQTWGMTLFMFIFLTIIYWSFKFIKKRDN